MLGELIDVEALGWGQVVDKKHPSPGVELPGPELGADIEEAIEIVLSLLRQTLDAMSRPLAGLFQYAGQSGYRAGPGGQHVQIPAVEGHDRHPIFGPEPRQLGLQGLQNRIAIWGQGEELVDEDQVAGAHRAARYHGRDLRDTGNLLRRWNLRGDSTAHFGEIVDRNLLPVDLEDEVLRSETPHRHAILVGDYDFQVHHPHIHHLGVDAGERAGGGLRQNGGRARQQQGEKGRQTSS